MSKMSEIDADAQRVCRVIPIRRTQRDPCAELAASIHADRAANALMDAADLAAGYRAEIIRAAADGDADRVLMALEGWMTR
jgi:hypothetical protein